MGLMSGYMTVIWKQTSSAFLGRFRGQPERSHLELKLTFGSERFLMSTANHLFPVALLFAFSGQLFECLCHSGMDLLTPCWRVWLPSVEHHQHSHAQLCGDHNSLRLQTSASARLEGFRLDNCLHASSCTVAQYCRRLSARVLFPYLLSLAGKGK